MDRRSFLRGTALAGSGLVVGVAASGCSSPGPHPAAEKGTTSPIGRNGAPPDWGTLAGSLRGHLRLPADAGFAAAGHLYNSLYTPDAAAIAQCVSTSDVQRCIAFARDHDVELAP